MLAQCKSAATATNARKTQIIWKAKARPVKTWQAGEEPKLHEMLEDETMRRLMARDRVDADSLLQLLCSVREKLVIAE